MSLSGCGRPRPRPQCVLTRKINDLLMSINGEQKMLVGHIPPAFSVSQSGLCPLISSTAHLLNSSVLQLLSTPNSLPTFANAAKALSSCSLVCAAESCTRMRACPCGTTG